MPRIPLTVKDRIIRSVKVDATGCWLWQLSINNFGYGRIAVDRDGKWVHTTAHRAAFETFRGDIPAGYDIDHLCRVRDCVNPDHLDAVSRSENLRRSPVVGRVAGIKRKKTHCVNGHALTDDNVIVRTSACGTRRFCKQCHLDRIRNCPTGRRQALKARAI